MPEGPEIRRAADQIEKSFVGRTIDDAFFAFPHLAHYADELSGQTLESLQTRGKAMLFHFSNGLYLYTHNLLWGKWYFTRRGTLPKTNRTLRVALHTTEASALLYSASEIEVLSEDEVASHAFLRKLGPDVLDRDLRARSIADRLHEKRFRGRALVGLLLDQAFLSGVGNYLRCEALFLAGVSPFARAGDYDRKKMLALGRALLLTARRAYEHAGRTVDVREVGARVRHYVFRRGGQSCLRCGTPVVEQEVGGRPLFFCPICQSA